MKTNHISISQQKVNWPAETQRLINWIRDTGVMVVYIDLFCGFGGTTSGVEKAMYEGRKMGQVILGINHDDIALACHKAHNPDTLHLREDIRKVKLQPIAEMIAEIRKALPWIKVFLWCSAECTHLSKAKGGDSRDPDSRSLAEELFRYEEAIMPDVIQVENVVEWRTYGPLEQKQVMASMNFSRKIWKHRKVHPKYGKLFSKNKAVWINARGFGFKKDKKKGVTPWMVPIPERKAEFFNRWKEGLTARGYTYQDKDINAADQGAYTSRKRYYGQFNRKLPVLWPEATHAKDPEKLFEQTGKRLSKYKPVREVLDFGDTGGSIFIPGRINSDQTFVRLTEGGIKFIAGGKKAYQKKKQEYLDAINGKQSSPSADDSKKEDFLIKYNGHTPAEGHFKHSIMSVDGPAPTVPCRNMIAKAHAQFLPFILQYNNNCNLNSVDNPLKPLTTRDKFYSAAFIQQRHTGNPGSKVYSVENPSRVVTASGGNQDLVQAQYILPFITNYHGNGHNCQSVNEPCPTIPAADTGALIQPEAFIYRQFSGGGQHQSVEQPSGSVLRYPKLNLVQCPKWIMDTNYNNVGKSVEESAQVITADRHHAYIVNPSYFGNSTSVNNSCPVIVARQDKAPLHLAQVQFGNETHYGIVIYKKDSKAVKELKLFMAIYGIVDIKMRMLKEMELLPIQGFPADYIEKVRAMGIKVTGTDAKKYIGNSQEVTTAKCLLESYGPLFFNLKEQYLKNAA